MKTSAHIIIFFIITHLTFNISIVSPRQKEKRYQMRMFHCGQHIVNTSVKQSHVKDLTMSSQTYRYLIAGAAVFCVTMKENSASFLWRASVLRQYSQIMNHLPQATSMRTRESEGERLKQQLQQFGIWLSLTNANVNRNHEQVSLNHLYSSDCFYKICHVVCDLL